MNNKKTDRRPQFVVHKHHATHLHYDFRLEMNGVLKSWALKALPIYPSKQVLAILVADHPFWYRHFEGVIAEGQYGAGPVMVWDKGLYNSILTDKNRKLISIEQSFQEGLMAIWIDGHKLKGGFCLIRISKKQKWLMIKLEDEYARHGGRLPSAWARSVKSNKTLAQILKKSKN